MKRVAALCGFVLLAAGCPGNDLRGRTHGIRDLVRQARENGAYKCAPRELAMAESHLEFANTELDDGKYFPAKREVAVAEDNARKALALSPKDRCNPPPKPPDTDGDGIIDKLDKCPTEPEDKDGFEDADGCPDPDNDKDGIPDVDDKCPNDPETKNGYQDQDGCPDNTDKCPTEPEDKDGFEDADGCPDPDNDKDGVLDAADKCPNDPGPPDNDGCPKKYEHIVVTQEKIELKQKIFFDTNKATIQPRSFPLLDEIANVLKSRPTMTVRIEGHTDSRGKHEHNMQLSQSRAESVRQHLVGLGIDMSRMEAKGYGPDQPIETNKTAAGREKNRRVEFFITQQ